MGTRLRVPAAIVAVAASWALGVGVAARAAAPPTPPVDRSTIPAGCVRCHGDPAIQAVARRHGLPPDALYVPEDALAGSVHAAVRCQSCHGTLSARFGAHAEERLRTTLGSCVRCHPAQASEVRRGTHVESDAPAASPLEQGELKGRRCVLCHGSHDVGPPMRAAGLAPPGGFLRGLPWLFAGAGAVGVGVVWLIAKGRRGARGRVRRRPSLRAS